MYNQVIIISMTIWYEPEPKPVLITHTLHAYIHSFVFFILQSARMPMVKAKPKIITKITKCHIVQHYVHVHMCLSVFFPPLQSKYSMLWSLITWFHMNVFTCARLPCLRLWLEWNILFLCKTIKLIEWHFVRYFVSHWECNAVNQPHPPPPLSSRINVNTWIFQHCKELGVFFLQLTHSNTLHYKNQWHYKNDERWNSCKMAIWINFNNDKHFFEHKLSHELILLIWKS